MGLQRLLEGRYRSWIDLGRDAGGRRRRYSEVVRGTNVRLAAEGWQDNGLVFTDGQGRPIDQYRLRRTFKRLVEDAGLPVVNLYSLRRTMASIMHALGVPAKVIASRMGHADTQALFRYYIKEFDAQDRGAAESMAAALRSARGPRGGILWRP